MRPATCSCRSWTVRIFGPETPDQSPHGLVGRRDGCPGVAPAAPRGAEGRVRRQWQRCAWRLKEAVEDLPNAPNDRQAAEAPDRALADVAVQLVARLPANGHELGRWD